MTFEVLLLSPGARFIEADRMDNQSQDFVFYVDERDGCFGFTKPKLVAAFPRSNVLSVISDRHQKK